MPFALIIAGLVLVVAAVQNTVTDNSQTGQKGLVTLVKGDFTGQNNFIYWMVSILVIGALGYIDSLKSFSRIVMALIVVVLFFNGNKQGISFFKNFQQALQQLGQGNFSNALQSLGPINSSAVSAVSPQTSTSSSSDPYAVLGQQALQEALGEYQNSNAPNAQGLASKAQNALDTFY